VKLAAAEPSEPHWTDPVPARIVFDEARTSRLGSPLAGRVTATMVERGQHVKIGDKAVQRVEPPGSPSWRAELEEGRRFERNTAKVKLRSPSRRSSTPARCRAEGARHRAAGGRRGRPRGEARETRRCRRCASRAPGDTAFTMTAPRDGGRGREERRGRPRNVDATSGDRDGDRRSQRRLGRRRSVRERRSTP